MGQRPMVSVFALALGLSHLILTTCGRNNPPDAPARPTGATAGATDQMLCYSSSAGDPDADSVSLRFDWDDGDTSEWSPLLTPGTAWRDSHAWQDPGTYRIAAQARDKNGSLSAWSEFLAVDIESTDIYPNLVLATIPVGTMPADIAVTPDARHVYVTCYGSNSVTVIRAESKEVVASIDVGAGPQGVAVSPDGGRVYVACSDGSVKVIATISNQVVSEVSLGPGVVPFGMAVSADGSRLYVADIAMGRLLAVDIETANVVATVVVGAAPHGVAVGAGDNYVYVACYGSNAVAVVRGSDHKVVGSIPVGPAPYWIASSPDGAYIYVAVSGLAEVKVVATASNTVSGSIPCGWTPHGVAVLGNYVYASSHDGNTVTVARADDRRVIDSISVAAGPGSVRASPDGRYVYVVGQTTGVVTVIGY